MQEVRVVTIDEERNYRKAEDQIRNQEKEKVVLCLIEKVLK